ncbi:GH3 auxin-responsive promoter family protein [bacterium]|nr:GH3 auxin-responsive promoter family protein [bacterium]
MTAETSGIAQDSPAPHEEKPAPAAPVNVASGPFKNTTLGMGFPMFWPVRKILAKAAQFKARRMRAHYYDLCKKPREVQHARLFDQIRREQETSFGRDHHFREIKTVDDFRRNIPITNYEYFQPYIERVKNGDFEALFHRQKVLMFAMSSGTTAARKFIPVTERYLDDYRRGWMIWGVNMFEDHRPLWFKTMIQLTSDWDEFRTSAGIPCGSISGLTAQMQRYIVRKTYCLPPDSAKIKETQTKYYLAWRLGLVRDVGIIMTANPSTVVNMARFGDERREDLIRDIHDGTLNSEYVVPESIYTTESRYLQPNPTRARELEAIIEATGSLRPKDVWPHFNMIASWMGGSVGAYMRHYPEHYGDSSLRDIGLIASEGRMTIPVNDGTPAGVLEITSSFFEFVPAGEMNSPNPTILEAHELEEGQDYFILLTTSSGFYRYNIYDVVRCVGFNGRTPLLTFLNKGANFSNLTGEKISEFQIVTAVNKVVDHMELPLNAFTLAPCFDPGDPNPFYGLFVEESDFPSSDVAAQFAARVENELGKQNHEYREKRGSGRLGPIRLQFLERGTWQDWDRKRQIKSGGSSEQYKHPCLIPDANFRNTMKVLEVTSVVA